MDRKNSREQQRTTNPGRGVRNVSAEVIGNRLEQGTVGTEKFNWMLFIGALVGGIIAVVLDKILYAMLYQNIPNIVLFGIIMSIFTLGVLGGSLVTTVRYSVNFSKAALVVLVSAAIMFICALVFEFIYELDFTPKDMTPTNVSISDYIFCIDDSGSMSGNDPDNQRYVALNDILNQLDESNNVGLIRFAGKVFAKCAPKGLDDVQIQEIADAYTKNVGFFSGAGTNFKAPLERAYKMYARLGITGRNQLVVLLSDGEASLDVGKMVEKYNEAGIAICTIYLGQGDEIPDVLIQLAEQTGGKAVHVQAANELIQTFNEIVQSTNQISTNAGKYVRFLWNARTPSDQRNILAILERILFFTIFGVMYGIALFIILGPRLERQRIFSACEGLLCGILMEIGFGIELPDGLVRFFILIMALVFAKYLTNGTSTLHTEHDYQPIEYRKGIIRRQNGNSIRNNREVGPAQNFGGYGSRRSDNSGQTAYSGKQNGTRQAGRRNSDYDPYNRGKRS